MMDFERDNKRLRRLCLVLNCRTNRIPGEKYCPKCKEQLALLDARTPA